MRKITAVMTVCAVLAGTLSSCSAAQNSSQPASRRRVSTAPLDQELIGTWMGEFTGYRFQDDRKISLVMDFSSFLHFDSSKHLYLSDDIVPDDSISYNGTELNVIIHDDGSSNSDGGTEEESSGAGGDVELLALRRKGEAVKETYNGEYDLVGGDYINIIADSLFIDPSKLDLDVKIDGEKFIFTAVDYCDYEVSEGQLDMFSENMAFIDQNADSVSYKYEIAGDELTLTYMGDVAGDEDDSEPHREVLKRAD